MSSKQPLKFSAGGQSHKKFQHEDTPSIHTSSSSLGTNQISDIAPRSYKSSTLSIIQHGLQLKRSPLSMKNWIACLLTLDGRDKSTKVLQYMCRMLSWWFGTLATSGSPTSGSTVVSTHGSMILLNRTKRIALYKVLSVRFNLLYKSFVESRKAFRMGRMFIEYDKLKSMGWGEYLSAMMSIPTSDGCNKDGEKVDGHEHLKMNYPTHSIPEHHNEDHVDGDVGRETWDEDDDEKKFEQLTENSRDERIVARPGRPHLPSRVSSNIGWGPGIVSKEQSKSNNDSNTAYQKKSPQPRTVSELGATYKSSPSSSFGLTKTQDTDAVVATALPPFWKLFGPSLKLIGLMGFWTFDNLAFLTGTGFLDPYSHSKDEKNDPKTLRLQRKKRASEWGARFYFMGAVAGLYVNLRLIWEHSHGALQQARQEMSKCVTSRSECSTLEVTEANQQLKQAETKHFQLYVSLLKSICDCLVFSNNPGVDLHMKYRGKKNHEGFHCCCGLISAGTVLFSNFPNA